ncbi:MAG: hypothetical protein AAB492_03245 [Patescibacteria group bacterium]
MKHIKGLVLLIGLTLILAACGPARETFRVVDPASPPAEGSYGIPYENIDRNKITCLVKIQAVISGQTFNEVTYLVPFDTLSGSDAYSNWYAEWNEATEDFKTKTWEMADAKLKQGLGLSDELWSSSFYGYAFRLDTTSGEESVPDYYSDPLSCPADWTVIYSMELTENKRFGDDTGWAIEIARPNESSTVYFTVGSQSGHVEFPLRESELLAILFNRYDPVKALDEITFMDPALETGVESYESRVLLYATQIQNDGELVARFSWTSIESQETVLDFVARTMLLKAWASGQSVHQPAFVGYLRDKVIAVTDVTIRSNPVRGGFILGFGTVSGGDATMNWHQTVTSEPAIQGDLYLLSK